MPPLAGGQYLLDYLHQVGPVMSGAHGPVEITWGEMEKWADRTGIDLEPWQFLLLRRLSSEYCSEAIRATKRDCPPPYASKQDAPTAQEIKRRNAVMEAKLEAFF